MNKQKAIYSGLDDLAKGTDPWEKTKEYQKESVSNILRLLQDIPHSNILEVGCADGKLTEQLVKIAGTVTGIDISASAIEKAKIRVPSAHFEVVSLEDFDADRKFDVIICSEVLYYILDNKKALKKLEKLGNYLISSHFLVFFPQFCLGSIKYEYYLRKFSVRKTIIEKDLKLGLLVIKRLRKL